MKTPSRLLRHPAFPWLFAAACGVLLAWCEFGLHLWLAAILAPMIFGFGLWHGFGKFRVRTPERLFAVLVLTFGIFMVFAVPPGQVPDENAHYLKAYMTGCGVMRSRQGGPIPIDVSHAAPAVLKQPVQNGLPHAWTTVSGYSPVPYLASGAAVLACRMTGCSYLCSIYAGRTANLLIYAALIFYAILLIPAGRWMMMLFALIPMALYEGCSLSADSFTIALEFFFIALSLHDLQEADRMTPGRWAALGITAVILAWSKPSYLVGTGILLLFPCRKAWKKNLLPVLAIWIPVLISGVLSSRMADASLLVRFRGSDPATQWAFVTGNPWAFVQILLNMLRHDALYFAESAIAVFGWLSIGFHKTFYVAFVLLLLLGSCAMDERPFPWSWRIWGPGLFGLQTLLIVLSLYLIWTAETGAPVVSGIQGRYFLPCLPLLGIGLTGSIPLRKYRAVTEELTVALLLALYGIVLLKLAVCNWPPVP